MMMPRAPPIKRRAASETSRVVVLVLEQQKGTQRDRSIDRPIDRGKGGKGKTKRKIIHSHDEEKPPLHRSRRLLELVHESDGSSFEAGMPAAARKAGVAPTTPTTHSACGGVGCGRSIDRSIECPLAINKDRGQLCVGFGRLALGHR